jgi:hypothetical protein
MNAAFCAQAWPFDWGRVGANQQDNGITRIEKAGSERELLSLFLSKLQKLDPDIIIGEFEVLLLSERISRVFGKFFRSLLNGLRLSKSSGCVRAATVPVPAAPIFKFSYGPPFLC